MARQRDHQQMLDKIADLREEMQNRERSITLEAPQWHELPPQVSLTWPLACMREESNVWQPGVVEVDGQGDVPAVSADCGYFKTSSWITHYPVILDSGKVSRVSEDPVCKGSQLVFYTGELTERVRSPLLYVRSETDPGLI